MANVIEILINAEDNASSKLNNFLDTLKGAAIVAGIAKMGELGAQVDAVEARFIAFAGSASKATATLDAIQAATGGTVDEMTAMQSATRLMSMGLADSADETATLINMALRLGDQTQSASDRIENFSLLLANTSIPRLDSFGISAAAVRNRIAELQEATPGLSREAAFMTAVMEQGAVSLDKLGDAGLEATKDIDSAKAAITDLKNETAKLLAPLVQTGARGFGTLAENANELTTKIKAVTEEYGVLEGATAFIIEGLFDVNDNIRTLVDVMEEENAALEFNAGLLDNAALGYDALAEAQANEIAELITVEDSTLNAGVAMDQYSAAISRSAASTAEADAAQAALAAQIKEAELAAADAESAFLDSAAALDEMSEKQFAQAQIQALRDAGIEGQAFVEAQQAILTNAGLLTQQEIDQQNALDALVTAYSSGGIGAEELATKMLDVKNNFEETSVELTASRGVLDDYAGGMEIMGGNIQTVADVTATTHENLGLMNGVFTDSVALVGDLSSASSDAAGDADGLASSISGITGQAEDAAVKVQALNDAITSIPEQKSVMIDVQVNETGGGAGAGGYGFQSGADFIVPPGYPNDTFPMRVSSGEHVTVSPSTTNNFNMTVNTAATAASVQQDFSMMRSMIGQ